MTRILARRLACATVAAGIAAAPLAVTQTASAAPTAWAASAAADSGPAMRESGDRAMIVIAREYTAGLAQLPGGRLEATFMAGMIPHHAAAVAMARLELQRGTHPQLKAMARQIITSQSAQIREMTDWLRAWYGLTPAQAHERAPGCLRALQDRMDAGMRQMISELAATPAGPGFDRAFLREMIPHHRMAVIESRPVAARAPHVRLAATARQIIAGQSQEIRQMREWLREWYGG